MDIKEAKDAEIPVFLLDRSIDVKDKSLYMTTVTADNILELRSIIRRTAAHPFGASATSALFNASGVSPSPGTTIQRTQPMAGFLLFCERTSIELRSIIRRTAAHPFGASATSALFNACGVSPSPGTTI